MTTKEQRQRQLAREKHERQQQRREQQRRKARRHKAMIAGGLAVLLAAGAAAYAAVGVGGTEEGSASSPTASPPPTGKAPDPCGKPAKGSPGGKRWKKEPALAIDTSASYTMKLETTCGGIEIALDAAKAPRTVNSFAFLAGKGYFDHTRCHRLTTQGIYVLQCGDPEGTGQGTPGYTIPDENLKDPKLKDGVYPAGTVAMANRYDARSGKGRDSGGSQFFLVYRDSRLPPDYTPFGTISGGMEVLKKITRAGAKAPDITGNTAPNATVVIDRATVSAS